MNIEKMIFYLSILSVVLIIFALLRELVITARLRYRECVAFALLDELYCGREGMLRVLGETYVAFLLPMSASLIFPFPLPIRVIIWTAIPVPAIIFKHFEKYYHKKGGERYG